MEDSLILQLSGCSPSTPSPRPSSTCRLVPLLGTPSKAPHFENLNRSVQKTAKSSVLHGVVAYVDVRSESDNRSRAVGYELQQLGATVVDKFSESVTHLVYKDGKKRTLDMALRRKIHLVSVLWVESCKQNQRQVPEEEFRVTLPKKQTPIGPIKFKRYKSMQPKSFDEDVVLSEEKVRRKQLRKEKVEKLHPLKTPDSGHRRRNFFVAETCRRSPTMDELVTPTSICVPDTPPSMRRHLAKSQSAKRASYAAQSSRFNLSVNPLQRKFSFDEDDSSPEPASSGSPPPLSRSSQDDSHPSVIANPRSSVNTPRPTADGATGSPVFSGRSSLLTESMSPEIELQTSAKPFVNSGSSFETEKKEIDSKVSDFKPMVGGLKSSPAKPEFETPSSKTERKPLWLTTKKLKRKHSPSIEEATTANKKPRIGEKVKLVEAHTPVTLIPLSRLTSKTPSRKKSGVGALHESGDDDSENLSERTKLSNALSDVRLKSLKSFVHSSPTSSQEASRSHKGATPLPSRTLPTELPPRNIERRLMGILPDVGRFDPPDALRCVTTPSNRPPTCADSLVLETRAQKRRSLVPFHDVLKTNAAKAASRRRTMMSGEMGSGTGCCSESPTNNRISPSKVILQRLPAAWDLSRTVSSEKSVTRKILSENGGIQSNAERDLNGVNSLTPLTTKKQKTVIRKDASSVETIVISPDDKQSDRDVGKSSSNGVNTMISPRAKQHNSDVERSRLNGLSTLMLPVTKQPKRDTEKKESCSVNGVAATKAAGMFTGDGSNPGAGSALKERNNEERRPRKTGKEKKMKKSASASSTSSSESIGRCSTPSIVITSLHRNEQKIVSDIVESLGSYVLSENVSEQTTHVVAGGNRRTVKVLSGISRGLWVLSLDWVKASAKKGSWLPEEPFELNDFFPAARLSRLERERWGRDYRHDLFSKVGDVFVAEGSAPPKEELEHLVSLCQGKITKQLRTAKVCVGKFLRQSITNVSEKWILDCITQHQCLPTTDYLLSA